MNWKSLARKALLVCCGSALAASSATAAEHLVPQAALEQAVAAESATRDARLSSVRSALSDERAEQAIENLGFEPEQVREAVAQLDDSTLARLAERADAALDPAGAALNNQQITYILIALATAVIILVIVAA